MSRKINRKRAKMQKKRQRQMRVQDESQEEVIVIKEQEKKRKKNKRKQRRKLRPIIMGCLWTALIAVLVSVTIYYGFRVKSIDVNGNEIYTEEEVYNALFSDGKNQNLFVFWLKCKTGIKKEEVSFLEKYDVKIKSPVKLEFTVYEKSLVGYIKNKDILLYFDRDGIVEKQTTEKIKGVPMVTGISSENCELYKKIPVADEAIFDLLLTVSQTIQKYDFKVKKIDISDKLEVSLFIKDVRVDLGTEKDLNEKIIDLNDMINGNLLKYKGTLNMKNLSKDREGYTLKKNNNSKENGTNSSKEEETTT